MKIISENGQMSSLNSGCNAEVGDDICTDSVMSTMEDLNSNFKEQLRIDKNKHGDQTVSQHGCLKSHSEIRNSDSPVKYQNNNVPDLNKPCSQNGNTCGDCEKCSDVRIVKISKTVKIREIGTQTYENIEQKCQNWLDTNLDSEASTSVESTSTSTNMETSSMSTESEQPVSDKNSVVEYLEEYHQKLESVSEKALYQITSGVNGYQLVENLLKSSDLAEESQSIKEEILKDIFGASNLRDIYGKISVKEATDVRIGSETKIFGPVTINQHINQIFQQNISNQVTVNVDNVPAKNCIRTVKRRDWLAQPPLEPTKYQKDPSKYVIICHTATESGKTQAENVHCVRLIQTYHIESKNWSDIGYNFLIGCDGNVYEGRGWKAIGAHSFGYNAKSHAFSFVGCFLNHKPPQKALDACKLLIENGVKNGSIAEDYKLIGHCQCVPFESPGRMLFEEIKTWKNWIPVVEDPPDA